MPATERLWIPVVACGLGAFASTAFCQTLGPAEIVRSTAADIAQVIDSRYVEFEGDVQLLYGLIDEKLLPRFDFRRGGRAILAENWEPATETQRQRFSTAFYNYLVASYGDLLIYFDSDTIRLTRTEEVLAEELVGIRTVLTLNDGTEVDVDFLMVETNEGWKIVDVIAEGISYVRTYRSQFRIQIASDGLNSVIEWLEEQASARSPK